MHVIANFRVEYKSEMNEKLDAAVAVARSAALAGQSGGVLVTRHDFNHFSVGLSPDVPFGLTRELDHLYADLSAEEESTVR